MKAPRKRSKPADEVRPQQNRPESPKSPATKPAGTAKSRRAAKVRAVDLGAEAPVLKETMMAEATLEQRLEWLQKGLREIGKMCLQLGGDGQGAVAVASSSGEQPPAPAPATSSPATPTAVSGDATNALAAGIPLRNFLEGVQDLTPPERLQVVDAAMTMLGQVFAHLPLKRAMHGIDPIQKLRLLGQRLANQIKSGEVVADARGFHDEMIEIFHSLRDLHTNYILPASYQGKTAFLPFMLQEFIEGTPRRRRYLVTRLLPSFVHPTFQVGVTVSRWNGIPIERAIELNAAREAGSNEDARHARGLESLTLRSMELTAPPDEDWVVIGYESAGQEREIRFDWRVTSPVAASSGSDIGDPTAMTGDVSRRMGFDAETVSIQRAKKSLFFPEEIKRESRMARAVLAASNPAQTMAGGAPIAAGLAFQGLDHDDLRRAKAAAVFGNVDDAHRCMTKAAEAVAAATSGPLAADDPTAISLMPDFFSFRPVPTPTGDFGYIRIFSFMAFDPRAFVAEFVRIAGLMPPNGLIIDLRGNGGGNINAGEQLLQVLTTKEIEPERFHFINTPTTLKLCKSQPSLANWLDSIDLSVQTGETYSQGFPLTSRQEANSLGRKYPGNVVLVIDALCYSTTDIFAAGFQDHEIGKILGTSGRTGAGGANVWTYDVFSGLEEFSKPLPKGVSFRTAIRRSTRVGARAGVPLEDLGVKPDVRHDMTRRDIIDNNIDLLAAAVALF